MLQIATSFSYSFLPFIIDTMLTTLFFKKQRVEEAEDIIYEDRARDRVRVFDLRERGGTFWKILSCGTGPEWPNPNYALGRGD